MCACACVRVHVCVSESGCVLVIGESEMNAGECVNGQDDGMGWSARVCGRAECACNGEMMPCVCVCVCLGSCIASMRMRECVWCACVACDRGRIESEIML